jgi:hypothetical protein
VQGELTLELAQYRRMVRAALGRRLWWYRGLGLLFIVFAGYLLVVEGPSFPVVVDLLLGCFFGVYDEVATRVGWHRLRRLTGRPWRYVVGEDAVGVHTPESDVELKWDGIAGVDSHPDVWILRMHTKRRVPIPRAAFSGEDATRVDERFATLADARSAAPPTD